MAVLQAKHHQAEGYTMPHLVATAPGLQMAVLLIQKAKHHQLVANTCKYAAPCHHRPLAAYGCAASQTPPS
jgi:hypothetical protein